MTKPSGFHGLLLPSDALVHSGGSLHLANDYDTHLIGVQDLVAYYDDALKKQGMVFLVQNSTKDPRQGGGYVYSHLYCHPGPPPVAIVAFTVGGLTNSDADAATARRAQIIFQDLEPEGTCP
jgi:hypothetical protein